MRKGIDNSSVNRSDINDVHQNYEECECEVKLITGTGTRG